MHFNASGLKFWDAVQTATPVGKRDLLTNTMVERNVDNL